MPSAHRPTKGKLSQGLELKRKYLPHDLPIIDRDAPSLSSKKRKCDNSAENELVQERYGSKVERIQRFASDDLDGRTTDSDAPFSTNRTNLCDPTTKSVIAKIRKALALSESKTTTSKTHRDQLS
ncbi:unnamed protein product [Alternaria alternata]